MFKLIVLYDHPDDEEAFLKYYREVHTPLVRKVPGLERLVVNRVVGDPMGGRPRFFLVAEMHFKDRAAFEAAAATPEFRATGKDVANFAAGKVTLLLAEEEEGL